MENKQMTREEIAYRNDLIKFMENSGDRNDEKVIEDSSVLKKIEMNVRQRKSRNPTAQLKKKKKKRNKKKKKHVKERD